ncbi:HoxN/HupN/NixA family nickel/cobalt transporter [Nocardia sp. NPDC004711]
MNVMQLICALNTSSSTPDHWAFSEPVRKVYYNLTITGLSIAVAFLTGTIELVGILHDRLDLTDPVSAWVGGRRTVMDRDTLAAARARHAQGQTHPDGESTLVQASWPVAARTISRMVTVGGCW